MLTIKKSSFLSPVLMRDLAAGLQQQMYFWGQDVTHSQGNLFLSRGFERKPSTGIKGTSCYTCEWQGGCIELYGSCAGWYGVQGGYCFIRPWRRSVIWNSKDSTPIPGHWQKEQIQKKPDRSAIYKASLPFFDWLISYEEFVEETFGKSYRQSNYESYRKVPKARAWMAPEQSLAWFKEYRERPESLVRPKKWVANA